MEEGDAEDENAAVKAATVPPKKSASTMSSMSGEWRPKHVTVMSSAPAVQNARTLTSQTRRGAIA